MNSDLTPEKLRAHIGHDIVIVTYYAANVALECETCGEVLADADYEPTATAPIHCRCPTNPTPYADPQPHDPPEGMTGCGCEFTATPDDEGLVDCPNCGLFFRPGEEVRALLNKPTGGDS